MAAAISGDERCSDCQGARLQGTHCLAHLTAEEWDESMQRLGAGAALDARSVEIDSTLLMRLFVSIQESGATAVPGDVDFSDAIFMGTAYFSDVKFIGDAKFVRATFNGDASFRDVEFTGGAYFSDVKFIGDAKFVRATFNGNAAFRGTEFSGTGYFRHARFTRDADFSDARFAGDASFTDAKFTGGDCDASFSDVKFTSNAYFGNAKFTGKAFFISARFGRLANFPRAKFSGDAYFRRATFTGDASFSTSRFGRLAQFSRAVFSADANFDSATFVANAEFANAKFTRARSLGPLQAGERLVLDRAEFQERVSIAVAGRVLTANRVSFAAGAHLQVHGAEIALDNADFIRPSILSGALTSSGDLDRMSTSGSKVEAPVQPRLVTLRDATVGSLALADLDLRACRFHGAHGLESLRIEESCAWSSAPPSWRYTVRSTIAEEHESRAAATADESSDDGGSAEPFGWYESDVRPPDWLERRDGADPLSPGQIGALYRALRKAREDSKDEAGAGDFYYGEMEMRRHSEEVRFSLNGLRRSGQRLLLTAYWLSSGYGLRASRALASLALTLVVCAGLLSWFGFHAPHSHGRSLLFALDSSISLLRAPTASLTAAGQVVDIILRLLGPLFFGLALLALRSRVKR